MQVENAINSWREWGGEPRTRPVVLGPLSGGRSNRSFLLDANGSKMVLRLNGMDSVLPGDSRNNEIVIWQAASKQSIAPPLLHVDDQSRFLVSTYIENSLPPKPPLSSKLIGQAFALLKQCHQLDIETPAIDYAGHIEKYWRGIESKESLLNPGLHAQRAHMQKVLDVLVTSSAPTAPCHHDPVAANFVGTENQLYLIDWEYAAHGLPVMDYAALGIEWGIDDATILAQTEIQPESLSMAKSLYRYLCALWEEVTA